MKVSNKALKNRVSITNNLIRILLYTTKLVCIWEQLSWKQPCTRFAIKLINSLKENKTDTELKLKLTVKTNKQS